MSGTFVEVFVPLLVAMNPLTVLPLFLNMTEGMTPETSHTLARRGLVTALCIAVGIVLTGQALFRFLGITVDDLRVAGGIILLLIASHDLVYSRATRKEAEFGDAEAGAVPLGTPLIVGPGTMTACVVLADTHGKTWVLSMLTLNLVLVALLLFNANRLKRVLRPSVTKAFGKVMSLFLAAIAVAMLRSGIAAFVASSAS